MGVGIFSMYSRLLISNPLGGGGGGRLFEEATIQVNTLLVLSHGTPVRDANYTK